MTIAPSDLERVLRRKTIPRGQVTLLKALYDADDYVPRDELVDYIRWGDAKSFTGVLSAFANRINATKGLREEKPGYEAFASRQPAGTRFAGRWRSARSSFGASSTASTSRSSR